MLKLDLGGIFVTLKRNNLCNCKFAISLHYTTIYLYGVSVCVTKDRPGFIISCVLLGEKSDTIENELSESFTLKENRGVETVRVRVSILVCK